MLMGADKIEPGDTHRKWVTEGQRLIKQGLGFFGDKSGATTRDSIFEMVRLMAYAAIEEGEWHDVEEMAKKATAEALDDWTELHRLMNDKQV